MTDFIQQPMITYIGNKRKLVDKIQDVVEKLRPSTCADAFSGSGVVSRMLLGHSEKMYVNDLEQYCEVLSKCFLKTPSWADQDDVCKHIENMNICPDKVGFITELYASNERQFYTPENGRRIDGMLDYIERCVPENLKPYCLGPLIVRASIHTNTSGVFKVSIRVVGVVKVDTHKIELQRGLKLIVLCGLNHIGMLKFIAKMRVIF